MGREPITSKYIEVRESEIHGTGVFARIKVPKGKKVIEYVGEKITKKESERRSIALIEKNQGSPTDGAVYIFDMVVMGIRSHFTQLRHFTRKAVDIRHSEVNFCFLSGC